MSREQKRWTVFLWAPQTEILQKQIQSSHKTKTSVTESSLIFFVKTSTFVYHKLKTLSNMFSKSDFNQKNSQGEPAKRRRPQASFLKPYNSNRGVSVAYTLTLLDEVLALLEDIPTERLPQSSTSTSAPKE
jgi:hypothetical protein